METAVCIRFSDLRDAVAVHRSFMSRDKHVHFDHTEHPDLEEVMLIWLYIEDVMLGTFTQPLCPRSTSALA